MYSYDHHLRVSCCDIHRNSVDFILRVEVRWQRNTVTPLQYFIPRVYYFFFFFVRFVFRYFFPDIFTSSCTFYAPDILLPWDMFTGNRFQRPGRRDGGDRKRNEHIIIARPYVPTYTSYWRTKCVVEWFCTALKIIK